MRNTAIYLAKAALLCLAYYASGRLGLELTIPPGQATAVWPASGIALAGLLILGPRYAPAVFFGAMGTSLYHPPVIDLQALVVAAAIATGACLQALVGFVLIRRMVALPSLLEQLRDILVLLMLGGPLSCLINATVGTLTLYLVGFVDLSGIPFHWMTWWTGDVMGVFVFTPITLLIFSPAGLISRQRKFAVGWSLGLMFLLVVYLFGVAKDMEKEQHRLQFGRSVDEATHTLRQDLDVYLNILYSIDRFIASTDRLSSASFQRYIRGYLEQYPGIQTISYNQLVRDEDRTEYEEAIRREGFPDFAIKQRSAPGQMDIAQRRPIYFPVTYLSPYEINRQAHGLDTYALDAISGNIRQIALDRARDLGQPVATGRLSLFQANDAYGLLVYHPNYSKDADTRSLEGRRASIAGYVAGVFIIPDLMRYLADDARAVNAHVVIHDIRADQRVLLYDTRTPDNKESATPLPVADQAVTSSRSISFAESDWELLFIENMQEASQNHNWSLWAVLVGGLLFTGLTGIFMLVVTARTAIVQRLVDDRTEELRQAMQAEQEASQAKSDFLANMSHELRTPMNAIIGLTQLTLETKLTSSQEEQLRGVQQSAYALLDIVNDILDLAKIEAGRLALDSDIFDPGQILNHLQAVYMPRAREKGLELRIDAAPNIPAWLVGDPGRLRQIIINLLGNAIKFTHEGGVYVTVGGEQVGEAFDLEIAVQDTGIGIPEEKHDQIFTAFTQADHSTTKHYGGTGLGLGISLQLAQMMGGTITLTSQVGSGSTFCFKARFRLPDADEMTRAMAVVAEADEDASPEPAEAPGHQWELLLAEDNAFNQKVAKGLLEKRGHRVDIVEDGAAAIEKTAATVYDAVLMDIQMPHVDGLEATQAIRERERHTGSYVPIVGLTAYAMKGDRERFLEAGMNGYIPKPIDINQLIATLAQLIEGADAAPERTRDPGTGDGPDWDLILSHVDGDEDLLKMLIETFLNDMSDSLDAIAAALESNNAHALARSAHRFKGAAATLDLKKAVDLLIKLEESGNTGQTDGAQQLLADLQVAMEGYRTLLQGRLDASTS